MSADALGEIVNGLIPFFGGLYAWFLGARKPGRPVGLDGREDTRDHRFGRLLTLLGPLLMLFGLAQILAGVFWR